MKKIFVFLAPAIIAAAMYGCSKDHESPTFGKFEGAMHQPVGLEATYNRTSDAFDLKWNMTDVNAVKMYNIAWSDSNVFDLGRVSDEFTNTLATDKNMNAKYVMKRMGYTDKFIADTDSFIVYFTVSAVYKNDHFNEFIGPRSDVDSALVYRK